MMPAGVLVAAAGMAAAAVLVAAAGMAAAAVLVAAAGMAAAAVLIAATGVAAAMLVDFILVGVGLLVVAALGELFQIPADRRTRPGDRGEGEDHQQDDGYI